MLKLQISQCCHLIVFFRSVGDLSGSKYDKWFLIEPEHFWDLASNINLFQLAFFDTCLTKEACGCYLLMPGRRWSSGFLLPLLPLVIAEQSWELWVPTWSHLPLCVGKSPDSARPSLRSPQWGQVGFSLYSQTEVEVHAFLCWHQVVSIDTMGGSSHYQPVRMKVLIPYLLLHYHILGWLIVSWGWMSWFPTWPLQE